MQNGRRWVWICLPFNHWNPWFWLLHVVQLKTFSFKCSFVSLQKPITIEDFHYRTMYVIFKPYFESENIINNEICELRIFFFFKFQSYTKKACKRKSTSFHNCCLPLHRITIRSSDYKVRMWLPYKLTNATHWQFADHISHYLAYEIFNLKLWFENNLHRLRMDFLSIRFCKQRNKQRMTMFFT